MYEEVVIDRNMKVNFKRGEYMIKMIFESMMQATRGNKKVKFTFTFLALRIYRYPGSLSPLGKASLVCHKNLF